MVKVKWFKIEEQISRINTSLGLNKEHLFIDCSSLDYKIVLYNINISFQSFVPFLLGTSFLYIVSWIASEPSTYRVTNLPLDANLIKVLLEAVECVMHWMWGVIVTLSVWILHVLFACMCLPSSLAFGHLVQVACLVILKEHLPFRLLGRLAPSWSLLRFSSTC